MAAHQIEFHIANIHENEVFTYSVAFIKGQLKCNGCELPINSFIRVGNADNRTYLNFPVVNGQFKSLCPLSLGGNSIHFYLRSGSHECEHVINVFRKPNTCARVVKLVYVVPESDSGSFQSTTGNDGSIDAALQKIVLGGKLLQTLTAERLYEQGFGRKTFNLDSGRDFEPLCHVHRSQYTRDEFQAMSSEEIWSCTARELLNDATITDSVKVLAFLSCTEYISSTDTFDYFKAMANTKAYVACGKGNLAMLGSMGFHSWASDLNEVVQQLTCQDPVDPNVFDDSGFRGTVGGCYATTLGSALHELGHAFDLVHADTGIMSRGFEDLDLFFTTARRKPASYSKRCENELKIEIKVQPSGSSKVSSFITGTAKSMKPEDGRAYFHRSAAVLLSGHLWFCEEDPEENCDPPAVNGLEIRAQNGIRLIEMHSEDEELVKYWEFVKNPVRVRRFCLNVHDIRKTKNPTLLIQDFKGNVVRQKVVVPF